MSGHSKWHNIQKTKGAQDAKRAQAFTKIAREMIVAVKEGGSGDPANNSRLAAVITKAKAANMPNDNIKRTIEKALGKGKHKVKLCIPYSDGAVLDMLHREAQIDSTDYAAEGTIVEAVVDDKTYGRGSTYIMED